MIIANQQPPEIAKPGEGAFDFPAFAVAPERATVVPGSFASAFAMGTDQQDALVQQAAAQLIAVVSPVGDDSQWPLLWSASSCARNGNPLESTLGQCHFRRAGRDQLASQRNTLAVDHHHPLRAFAAFGFADTLAPFLAGAKLPSRNDSLQSSLPRWSNSLRNCRQILSHTSCSSHCRRRRQHVLGLGYSLGRSRQRAPVLSIQRMPSSTRRLSAQGRPRLRSLGRSGSIFAHCSSDKNAFCIPSFSQIVLSSTSIKCYKD